MSKEENWVGQRTHMLIHSFIHLANTAKALTRHQALQQIELCTRVQGPQLKT